MSRRKFITENLKIQTIYKAILIFFIFNLKKPASLCQVRDIWLCPISPKSFCRFWTSNIERWTLNIEWWNRFALPVFKWVEYLIQNSMLDVRCSTFIAFSLEAYVYCIVLCINRDAFRPLWGINQCTSFGRRFFTHNSSFQEPSCNLL